MSGASQVGTAGIGSSAASRWAIRGIVLSAFALTVWWCGPRAVDVLAARFQKATRHSPRVALDRVQLAAAPDWLSTPLLRAVTIDVAPWLQDEVPILDEASARRWRDGLMALPWVREVGIERVFPDRFKLHLELRRPVLAVRDGQGEPLGLVDRSGVAMPFVDAGLPQTVLHGDGGPPRIDMVPGQPVTDPRVQAAAAIAVEWRDEVAPLVPDCPALLEVDATNLGERWMVGPRYPEIRVKLRRGDGAAVVFNYDRPVGSAMPRVPASTKAGILVQVLKQHPSLDGLVAGDLRLARRWADWLQPRRANVADPAGPWRDLPVPGSGTGGANRRTADRRGG